MRSWAAAVCTTIALIEWAMTSWSSRAIRSRSLLHGLFPDHLLLFRELPLLLVEAQDDATEDERRQGEGQHEHHVGPVLGPRVEANCLEEHQREDDPETDESALQGQLARDAERAEHVEEDRRRCLVHLRAGDRDQRHRGRRDGDGHQRQSPTEDERQRGDGLEPDRCDPTGAARARPARRPPPPAAVRAATRRASCCGLRASTHGSVRRPGRTRRQPEGGDEDRRQG